MAENQKEPSRGLPPGMPRWVKLIIIVFIVLVAAVVVLHLMGLALAVMAQSIVQKCLPAYKLTM